MIYSSVNDFFKENKKGKCTIVMDKKKIKFDIENLNKYEIRNNKEVLFLCLKDNIKYLIDIYGIDYIKIE